LSLRDIFTRKGPHFGLTLRPRLALTALLVLYPSVGPNTSCDDIAADIGAQTDLPDGSNLLRRFTIERRRISAPSSVFQGGARAALNAR
jgi:hypothetical protein